MEQLFRDDRKVIASYSKMPLRPHVRAMCDAAMEIVGRQTFGGAFADRDAAIAAYRRRTEEVRATIARAARG